MLVKHINCHVQCENWVTFLDFRLSEGSVATYCRWGWNLCDVYIDNFLTNHQVKELWKSVHICQSYYQTSSGLLFLEHDVEWCGIVATTCWRKYDDILSRFATVLERDRQTDRRRDRHNSAISISRFVLTRDKIVTITVDEKQYLNTSEIHYRQNIVIRKSQCKNSIEGCLVSARGYTWLPAVVSRY